MAHEEEHDPYIQAERLEEALNAAEAEIEALEPEAETARYMREIAQGMGYPSTLEALEAVEEMRARVAELEGAEDRAWHEARELVRGTNADLCKTATSAYRVIYEGINNAVNNKQLRTLAGRVKALSERQP